MTNRTDVVPDREICLPPSLHDLPLFDLPLRRHTADALLRAGLVWVGDLHGRSLVSLLQIRRFGPRSVSVLIDALAVVWRRSAAGRPALTGTRDDIPLASLGFGEVALRAIAARGVSTLGALRIAPDFLFFDAPVLGRVLCRALHGGGPGLADPAALREAVLARPEAAPLLAVPRELWPVPVSALEISPRTPPALGRRGIERLGQLDCLTAEDLPWLAGITPAGAAGVARAVGRVRRLSPAHEVLARWTDESGSLRLPDLPLAVLHKLAQAESLDDEVRALVGCLGPRNAALVLARWGADREVPATFTRAGQERGISRERVRQVLAVAEAQLMRCGIILPLGSRIVELLAAAGGRLDTERFLAVLERASLRTTRAALNALPPLARLGIVPPVAYSPENDVWSSPGWAPSIPLPGYIT